jgi:hypothetical protein
MDEFWGDSNDRGGPQPGWPANVAVKVDSPISAEIERQTIAARWHRLRCGGSTPRQEDIPASARIIDDFPAIRARLVELRAGDVGLAELPRHFSAAVLDSDWLNGVQEEVLRELAAADRSPIEADVGPSPSLILDDPV